MAGPQASQGLVGLLERPACGRYADRDLRRHWQELLDVPDRDIGDTFDFLLAPQVILVAQP